MKFSLVGPEYIGGSQRKNIFRWIWEALPKYLLWKLWLARNRAIFNYCLESLVSMVNIAKSLRMENLIIKNLPL
jgi:hypothetical protein